MRTGGMPRSHAIPYFMGDPSARHVAARHGRRDGRGNCTPATSAHPAALGAPPARGAKTSAPVSRRNNAGLRCRRCRLHASLCLCPLIPRVETRTRLVLVIHRAEDRKSTNTGRLATECLPNSEIVVRGHASQPSAPIAFPDGAQPLLLFP